MEDRKKSESNVDPRVCRRSLEISSDKCQVQKRKRLYESEMFEGELKNM